MCGLHPGSTQLLSPVVMVNLLGDAWKENGAEPSWQVLMQAPNAKLHLYGKKRSSTWPQDGAFLCAGSDGRCGAGAGGSPERYALIRSRPFWERLEMMGLNLPA